MLDQALFDESICHVCVGASSAEAVEMSLWLRYLQRINPEASVTPEALDELAKCYECYAPSSVFQMRKLAVLSQIATTLDPTADVTPESLLEQSGCTACLGMTLPELLELGLLQIIAENA